MPTCRPYFTRSAATRAKLAELKLGLHARSKNTSRNRSGRTFFANNGVEAQKFVTGHIFAQGIDSRYRGVRIS